MKNRTNAKVYRYSSIAYVLDALARKEMTLLDPKSWADKNDSLYVDLYKQYRGAGAVFASCCTLSTETFHHWYVFGGTHAGAFIEYDRTELESCFKSLKAQGHKIRYAKVKYFTLGRVEKDATLNSLPFLKRWGFQSEREYRVIVETDDESHLAYRIPIPMAAINRVVINPWLPDPVVETLRARIHSISECANLTVDHSRLIDSDRWKAAGIRMVAGYKRRHNPVYKRLREKKR
jgi:hypothetical protein